jgi:spore germination protein KA
VIRTKYLNNIFRNKKNVQIASAEILSINIEENISCIKSEFGDCSDLFVNLSKADNHIDLKYASTYIDNLVDKNTLNSLSVELTGMLKSKYAEKNKLSNPIDTFINCLSCFSNRI